jgi:hypothetical protein
MMPDSEWSLRKRKWCRSIQLGLAAGFEVGVGVGAVTLANYAPPSISNYGVADNHL